MIILFKLGNFEIDYIKKSARLGINHNFIRIQTGLECGDRLKCSYREKCKKYANRSYILHNMKVDIRDFFEYRLHIKLPHIPIYVEKKYARLSGTKSCPFNLPRNYTCYDCKWIGGDMLRDCLSPRTDPKEYPPDEWHRNGQCKYFEKCSWADDYKETSP